jgi:hypothetical protein
VLRSHPTWTLTPFASFMLIIGLIALAPAAVWRWRKKGPPAEEVLPSPLLGLRTTSGYAIGITYRDHIT